MQGFGGGLVTDAPAHALDGTQSPDAENFDPGANNRLKKRAGWAAFAAAKGSPTGTVINGFWVGIFEDGTAQLLAKEGTVVADITGGSWGSNISGYTPADGDKVYFSMFNNVVIATSSAYVAPKKKAKTGAFSALGGSPPSAAYSCTHRRRLWLAKTSADPSRVYCSNIDNAEDWSTADAVTDFYLDKGDGQVINGMVSNGELLYISKIAGANTEGSLFAVAGDTPTGARGFAIKKLCTWGAVSQWAMVSIDKYIAIASQDGIFLINGLEWTNIAAPIMASYQALTAAQKLKIVLGRKGRQLFVSYPASGSVNTKTWVFDLDARIWSRYTYTAGIWATHPDGSLYGAAPSTTIKVDKFDTGLTDNSAAIAMYWETPNLDFGEWFADKKWFQAFLFTSSAGNTWTLDHYIDDVDQNDNQTFVSASGTIIKRVVGKGTEKFGRLFRFNIAESSTAAAECYGIQVEADAFPRTR